MDHKDVSRAILDCNKNENGTFTMTDVIDQLILEGFFLPEDRESALLELDKLELEVVQ